MPVMRTETIELDVEKISDFTLDVDICKAQEVSGRRFLTGVASGVLEDTDGERVSKRCIADMSRQAVKGLKLVAGSHAQDWHNEIGDAVELRHDAEHDELLVKCELPPEGEDALADKAWLRQTKYGEKLGFSIGGKLQKAYFEVTDTGKKRKVLDGIGLKHFALTKKPSYRQSFSLAVAKTASELEVPADDAFTIEADVDDDAPIVAKMEGWTDPVVEKTETSEATQAADRGNAGTQGADTERPEVNNDDDDDSEQLPDGAGERHLACPNCGHEFAAAMPADKDTPADAAGDTTTGKRAADPEEEGTMPLDKTLENLRKLAGTGDETQVEKKKDDEEGTGTGTETAAEAGLSDVEKLVAASHEANQESIDTLKTSIGEGFKVVEKAVQNIYELVGNLPAGRQSIARVQKASGEGAATRAEVEAGSVAKTGDTEVTDEEIGKIAATDPVKALALHNRRHGIESNIADRPTGAGSLADPRWDD